MSDERVRIERVYRSLPLWLACEYLAELGGDPTPAQLLQGDGWTAQVLDEPPFEIGALHVGQTRVRFEGDAVAVNALLAAFERKALRAGG